MLLRFRLAGVEEERSGEQLHQFGVLHGEVVARQQPRVGERGDGLARGERRCLRLGQAKLGRSRFHRNGGHVVRVEPGVILHAARVGLLDHPFERIIARVDALLAAEELRPRPQLRAVPGVQSGAHLEDHRVEAVVLKTIQDALVVRFEIGLALRQGHVQLVDRGHPRRTEIAFLRCVLRRNLNLFLGVLGVVHGLCRVVAVAVCGLDPFGEAGRRRIGRGGNGRRNEDEPGCDGKG